MKAVVGAGFSRLPVNKQRPKTPLYRRAKNFWGDGYSTGILKINHPKDLEICQKPVPPLYSNGEILVVKAESLVK